VIAKKFISIKNVGRLVNCAQQGPELGRNNLLFAENGRGKTTLCAVLRSLQSGDPAHIQERKTIGAITGDPSATIRFDSGNATFGKNGWNTTVPEISIFDATFVSRNVHAGEYVERDQRSNLLQVIVGEVGVKLAEEVSRLDDAVRSKNGDISKSRKALQAIVPVGMKLEDFVTLPADTNMTAKLAAKLGEHDAVKQAEAIKARQALSPLPIPTIPDSIAGTLAKTLPDISIEAEKLLQEHISHCRMRDGGERWLSEGLKFVVDDGCPFCGQDTKKLPLVDAYKRYFSAAYEAHIKSIGSLRAAVEAAFGRATLATLGRSISSNDAAIQFWKPFIDTDLAAPAFDSEIEPGATAFYEAAIALVAAKQSSPLAAIALNSAYTSAAKSFAAITKALLAHNDDIRGINEKIAAQKQRVAAANLTAIERDLALLKAVKLRHEPNIAALCNEYAAQITEKDKLDRNKESAKSALDGHADKMIGDYEKTINALLRGFGAGFSITNSKKTYIGGTPTSVYQILINDQSVDLGDSSTPLGEPCFRTTLSAGDKSTLALAFFLAQLDHDPTKARRIVVFDDPFNSQDRSRRERTAELLKRYGQECAQMVLLSHDPFFLSLVYSKLSSQDRRTLQLSRAANNTTTIEDWDVEKETQEGYFRDHAALSSYLLHGAKHLIDVARKIRPVLEGYLRYRFPNQFPDNEWLGDMIGRIRIAGANHPMYLALAELSEINDYSKKYHHDTNPGKADSEPLNDGELQAYVKRSLDIAGGY